MAMMFSVLLVPSNTFSTPVFKGSTDVQINDIPVSNMMTFEEMVTRYAEVGGISYQDARKAFPSSNGISAYAYDTYCTVSVPIRVTDTYQATLEFYCKISVGDGVWGIMSIDSIQMNSQYQGVSRQFGGDVQVWMRGPLSIEYVVNGDFFNNGTTTTSGGGNLNLGIDDSASMSYFVSNITSTSHYQYCYQHETARF